MQIYYIISLLNGIIIFRGSRLEVFLQISQNSQESTCARISFLINFIKNEALAQMFSCEFCTILSYALSIPIIFRNYNYELTINCII